MRRLTMADPSTLAGCNMARKKIKVTCPCVADRNTGSTERVVEFTGDRLGGLISIKQWEDGTITVEVYRADAGVKVRVGGQDHDASH